jgi:hypothetical protein
MHIEVVERETVSDFSWGPRAKISKNLIDQWCEQGDICPSILHKLVPLSSICSDTHNENSTWSMSIKTGLVAVTNHGTFSELAIGCLENNLGLVHVNHLLAAYICNTKRIWQMPEALSLEYVSRFTSLSHKCRRLLSRQANTMFCLGNLAFIVPLSSCSIQESNLLKSCSMKTFNIQR